MKIALCLSGQPRGLPTSFYYLHEAILSTNPNIDVFIHNWYHSSLDNIPFDSAQTHMDNKLGVWMKDTDSFIMNNLHPKKCLFEPPNNFPQFSHLENLPTANQCRLASMFYSAYIANQLKCEYESQNNFKYDIVIKTRLDIAYAHRIFIKELIDIDIDKVLYVPERYQYMRVDDSYPIKSGGSYSSMSDTFIFGRSDKIDIACSIYPKFEEIYNQIWPYAYGEAFLGYVVRGMNRIPISMKPINYTLYRGS